jgi:DNA-binding SARP family transcriptional activator
MLLHRWHIQMLGVLKASRGTEILTEFRSQKVASLLAYLAFYPSLPHSRDELQALLWPDELDAVRNRLRVSLSSLRRQMEPPGTPSGSVLIADRLTIRLNLPAITTDVALFEEAFAVAWADGHATPLKDSIALALHPEDPA